MDIEVKPSCSPFSPHHITGRKPQDGLSSWACFEGKKRQRHYLPEMFLHEAEHICEASFMAATPPNHFCKSCDSFHLPAFPSALVDYQSCRWQLIVLGDPSGRLQCQTQGSAHKGVSSCLLCHTALDPSTEDRFQGEE